MFPSEFTLFKFLITYLLSLTEPLVHSSWPPIDVPKLLNRAHVNSALESHLTAIYIAKEKEFASNNDTLIYVEPTVVQTWNNLKIFLRYGLYSLTSGKTLSGRKEETVLGSNVWFFEKYKSFSEVQPPTSQNYSPLSVEMLESMYSRPPRLTPRNYRLVLARAYLNFALAVLCLILMLLHSFSFQNWQYSWVIRVAVAMSVLSVRTCYLTVFAVSHSKIGHQLFALHTVLLGLNLLALYFAVVDTICLRVFSKRSENGPDKFTLAASDLTFSSTSGLDLVPSPINASVAPTLDIINSLSTNEEKVQYNGRIHPPLVLPRVRKSKKEETGVTVGQVAKSKLEGQEKDAENELQGREKDAEIDLQGKEEHAKIESEEQECQKVGSPPGESIPPKAVPPIKPPNDQADESTKKVKTPTPISTTADLQPQPTNALGYLIELDGAE